MAGFICGLPLVASFLTSCAPALPLASGYVEGDYILIGPITTARIDSLKVRRGDRVTAGQVLAILEKRDAEIALAETKAALARAISQLENLRQGHRAEEIAVIDAALASARAHAVEAEKEANRLKNLFQRGAAPEVKIDAAQATLNIARAKVDEVRANLAVAKLPARAHQIAAAEAAVTQAQARKDAATWRLERRTILAPANGIVDEVLRNAGEISSPQAPILSILPNGAVKLRLYVPEKAIASISIGTVLKINCDGCSEGASAHVTYVSNSPEFTPPVIYSLENRQKLVYLIEAAPDKTATSLKPGQIVDADLKGF